MPPPPLYKYLDVQGAKLTLDNRTFKHAKPSDFNDVADLTVQSIFPEETEAALVKLTNGFVDIILQHLDDHPTCDTPAKEQIALIQHVFRTNAKAAEIVRAELSKLPIFDVDHMRERSAAFLKDINESMQNWRVLCVTTRKDSDRMWCSYAENHKGIALRIEPNTAKDSKFKLFRPVEYREERPPLFDDALAFLEGSLFGDREARIREALEKIIYTKTLPWQHEAEYRFAIPLGEGEKPWNVLPYHPEEITELYLGLAMSEGDKDEIVSAGTKLNPDMVIFQVNRDANGKLIFNLI